VRLVIDALIVLACCAAGATAIVVPHTSAAPAVPIVVELFTSEGCSSCPAADVLLEKLTSSGTDIIGLGVHVDYWDRLGWKDRFSSAALTNRQRVYQNHFGTESIYTPQMVVDGRTEFVGSDASAARRAIERAQALPHGLVRIATDESGSQSVAVRVDATDLPRLNRGDRADIVVVVTESHLRSDVQRGENRGKTLTHAAVVRYLATIGQAGADGSASARAEIPLSSDWQRSNLKIVAFVQEQRSRAILASAATPLTAAHP
jgi:hypothetical protein